MKVDLAVHETKPVFFLLKLHSQNFQKKERIYHYRKAAWRVRSISSSWVL